MQKNANPFEGKLYWNIEYSKVQNLMHVEPQSNSSGYDPAWELKEVFYGTMEEASKKSAQIFKMLQIKKGSGA